ncbi:MAG: RNA polymerase sigma factor [Dehalococcoidia bacterium]
MLKFRDKKTSIFAKNMMSYETKLIQRSKDGDLDSFNQLVKRYQGQVYNLALRMLGTSSDAEDITQETFILAWKDLRSFRGDNFRTWIFRIASDACADLLRGKRGYEPESSNAILPGYNPLPVSAGFFGDCVLQEELSWLISQMLLCLPAEQRLIVILADIQGLGYEEIAQVANIPLGTVKLRLSCGRANLRDLLLKRHEPIGSNPILMNSETVEV